MQDHYGQALFVLRWSLSRVSERIKLVWIYWSLSWSSVVGSHQWEVKCTVDIRGNLTGSAFLGSKPPGVERALCYYSLLWLICGTRLIWFGVQNAFRILVIAAAAFIYAFSFVYIHTFNAMGTWRMSTLCVCRTHNRQVYLKPGGSGREPQPSVKMHVTA